MSVSARALPTCHWQVGQAFTTAQCCGEYLGRTNLAPLGSHPGDVHGCAAVLHH
jgi:hypothetical protein